MKKHIEFDVEFKKNLYPGKFIVFEGIDGSGKTTQAKVLKEELEEKGHKVFTTKNPTDHVIGKFIRTVLSGKEKIPPQAIQYLFNADRVVQQEDIIEHLKKGEIVISDRYCWSSVAYGMADIGEEPQRLLVAYSILSFYHRFLLPDLTVFLDTKTNIAIKRLGAKPDHEIYENTEFLSKAQNTYKALLDLFPKDIFVIDSNQDFDLVSKAVLEKANEILV